MKVWLDVSVLRCPNCGSHHADASWHVAEMESDIQCGNRGEEFNSKKSAADRALLEFQIRLFGENSRSENHQTLGT